MTREEAKEIFINRGFVNGLFDGDKWRQSIVVISEWLEQEPCEEMSEVGVEIIKTEETEKSGIKYLNINVSNSEVERNPDIVRLCSDIGILEYLKQGTEGGKE